MSSIMCGVIGLLFWTTPRKGQDASNASLITTGSKLAILSRSLAVSWVFGNELSFVFFYNKFAVLEEERHVHM